MMLLLHVLTYTMPSSGTLYAKE